MPHPDKKTIPTEHFLEKIEKKYARRINGDADMSRIITGQYNSVLEDEVWQEVIVEVFKITHA